MGANSKIGWTHHTYNPWWGCTKVSPGCAHCYAENVAHRYVSVGLWGDDATRRQFGDKHWNAPLMWDKAARRRGVRERVFCGSMCDWLEDREDLRYPRLRLTDLVRNTPQLDWLLLTKRPENFTAIFERMIDGGQIVMGWDRRHDLGTQWRTDWFLGARVPHNVWMGVSAEDQKRLDVRCVHLQGIPAAVRFLSIEPLLAPVRIYPGVADWVIIGCESGPRRRPCSNSWVRVLVAQCREFGIPVFVKQIDVRGQVTTDVSQFPRDLRIQEFPGALASAPSTESLAEP